MNRYLAGLPGRALVEAEHEGRLALALAIHGTRHRVLSRRAVPHDRFHVIAQLDLMILTCGIRGSHTLSAQRIADGYEPQAQHHKRPTLDSGEHWRPPQE